MSIFKAIYNYCIKLVNHIQIHCELRLLIMNEFGFRLHCRNKGLVYIEQA